MSTADKKASEALNGAPDTPQAANTVPGPLVADTPSVSGQAAQQAGQALPEPQQRFDYRRAIRKRFIFLFGGLLVGLVLAVVDLLTGAANVATSDVMCVISQWVTGCEAPKIAVTVVKVYRVPTVLTAIGVGASLGVAGSIMQTILRNPLASPYTLGISAGAGFGAALTIVTGFAAIEGLGIWLVPFNAFVFALLTCLLIYGIGSFKRLTPGTMILAGIGLSFLFNALQSMMQYGATAEQNQNIVFWLFGSLSKSDTSTALLMLGLVLVLLPMLMVKSWQFTALQLGDEKAIGLGINVKRLRLMGFAAASLLTATAVSFVGTIGFVGLAGPHVARLLVGEDQRFFMPLSALFGSLILLLADIVSKSLLEGFVFPIGIITSLIGVPVFFSVVLSKRRSYFS